MFLPPFLVVGGNHAHSSAPKDLDCGGPSGFLGYELLATPCLFSVCFLVSDDFTCFFSFLLVCPVSVVCGLLPWRAREFAKVSRGRLLRKRKVTSAYQNWWIFHGSVSLSEWVCHAARARAHVGPFYFPLGIRARGRELRARDKLVSWVRWYNGARHLALFGLFSSCVWWKKPGPITRPF